MFLIVFVGVITNIKLNSLLSLVMLVSTFIFLSIALPRLYYPYMNFPFYVMFSSALYIVWIFVVFVGDRQIYWRISPGQISITDYYSSQSLAIAKMSVVGTQDNVLLHYVLGLGVIGDIEIQFESLGGAPRVYTLKNVLFVNRVMGKIRAIIAQDMPD